MAKYYCEYCKSYLTHDTTSVRKSHLAGRNHIKLYCQFYEKRARQLGLWDTSDTPYKVTLDYVTSTAPLPQKYLKEKLKEKAQKRMVKWHEKDIEVCLPPPPILSNMPAPPLAPYRHTEEHARLISVHLVRETPNFW